MTLDEILDIWNIDSIIDDNNLGIHAIETAKLHSKYLNFLMESKLKKTKLDQDFNILKKNKIRYYRGELTRKELESFGWEPWQYNKPLKNEMDEFLKGDEDLSKIKLRIEYIDVIIYALESIMQQIKSRDWSIKNAISWKQFMAGS